MNLRSLRLGIAAAAVLAAAAFFASPYVPVDAWQRNDFTDPVTISPAQAYRFVLNALAPAGGLPPDAQLALGGGMTMMESGGAVHRMSYDYLWYPRDQLEFGGIRDIVTAQVVSAPRIACLRSDCSRYTVTYEPRLQSFMRTWHPAWWRSWLQFRIRRTASFVPAPYDVKTSCPGGVDIGALRRVIGNARAYLPSDGPWQYRAPRELAVSGTTIARFAPAPIAQRHGYNVTAAGAIVSDAPPKTGRYREVRLLVANPWPWKRWRGYHWLVFASDDIERTCNGIVAVKRPAPRTFTNDVLPYDALGDDAVYRSTEEARRRTHNPPRMPDAQFMSIARAPEGGAVVRTRHDDGSADWIGTFEYDARGALIRAIYEKQKRT